MGLRLAGERPAAAVLADHVRPNRMKHITEVKLQTIKGHIYRKLKIRKPIELAHYCLFFDLVRNLFNADIKHAAAPRHD